MKTQPEGPKPSNRGTSSFIFGGLVKWVGGLGMAEDEKGEATRGEVFSRTVMGCIRSSSFSITWIWLEANLTMTSSRRSQLDLDRVDSAMVSLLMKAPKLL